LGTDFSLGLNFTVLKNVFRKKLTRSFGDAKKQLWQNDSCEIENTRPTTKGICLINKKQLWQNDSCEITRPNPKGICSNNKKPLRQNDSCEITRPNPKGTCSNNKKPLRPTDSCEKGTKMPGSRDSKWKNRMKILGEWQEPKMNEGNGVQSINFRLSIF
jgi:hypothetical protein